MTHDPASIRIEPYRIFFPLGYILAVLGLGLWLVDCLEPGRLQPGEEHAILTMRRGPGLRQGGHPDQRRLPRPVGRLAMPEEIAGVILCSAEASYVTGHALAADGGWVAQ